MQILFGRYTMLVAAQQRWHNRQRTDRGTAARRAAVAAAAQAAGAVTVRHTIHVAAAHDDVRRWR